MNLTLHCKGSFQSPGPSQAPTFIRLIADNITNISIPRALAGPDGVSSLFGLTSSISIPRALAGPDKIAETVSTIPIISIPRALAGPDVEVLREYFAEGISIPRALAGPDELRKLILCPHWIFQSPGPSQAPTGQSQRRNPGGIFQSPGPSQAPTEERTGNNSEFVISIPRALAGPDPSGRRRLSTICYFNPQGPRRPRRSS